MEQNFKNWVAVLSDQYKKAQIKASIRVSSELIAFNLYLGGEIRKTSFKKEYGSKFFQVLSNQLEKELPNSSGFSPKNLAYMERFYTLYKEIYPQVVGQLNKGGLLVNEDEILQQVVAKLSLVPWGHHRLILDSCNKNPIKALFYVDKVIQSNLSRSELSGYILNNLFEREGKSINNFDSLQMPSTNKIYKDPYMFDLMGSIKDYKEKEFKIALVEHIDNTLKEFGPGFAYVGKEFRITVGKSDFYIDMLFYYIPVHSYVVVEIKNTNFKPEFLGQLNFYVTAVDKDVKQKDDNPTIGVLLCKEKDNKVVQYSLNGFQIPLGVSSFDIQKLLPKDFKSELPTVEELENDKRKQ